jgi:hypothetical protein
MKKLLLIFTLLFSTLMFSTPSYGEWTKMYVTTQGDTIYVDFEGIKKHGGYVYYWQLIDFLKPSSTNGSFSSKHYNQADCKLLKYQKLSILFYNEPMGGGIQTSDSITSLKRSTSSNPFLFSMPPNSPPEEMLKRICNQS